MIHTSQTPASCCRLVRAFGARAALLVAVWFVLPLSVVPTQSHAETITVTLKPSRTGAATVLKVDSEQAVAFTVGRFHFATTLSWLRTLQPAASGTWRLTLQSGEVFQVAGLSGQLAEQWKFDDDSVAWEDFDSVVFPPKAGVPKAVKAAAPFSVTPVDGPALPGLAPRLPDDVTFSWLGTTLTIPLKRLTEITRDQGDELAFKASFLGQGQFTRLKPDNESFCHDVAIGQACIKWTDLVSIRFSAQARAGDDRVAPPRRKRFHLRTLGGADFNAIEVSASTEWPQLNVGDFELIIDPQSISKLEGTAEVMTVRSIDGTTITGKPTGSPISGKMTVGTDANVVAFKVEAKDISSFETRDAAGRVTPGAKTAAIYRVSDRAGAALRIRTPELHGESHRCGGCICIGRGCGSGGPSYWTLETFTLKGSQTQLRFSDVRGLTRVSDSDAIDLSLKNGRTVRGEVVNPAGGGECSCSHGVFVVGSTAWGTMRVRLDALRSLAVE